MPVLAIGPTAATAATSAASIGGGPGCPRPVSGHWAGTATGTSGILGSAPFSVDLVFAPSGSVTGSSFTTATGTESVTGTWSCLGLTLSDAIGRTLTGTFSSDGRSANGTYTDLNIDAGIWSAAWQAAQPVLQPYVALGDSYSSGEGNPPFEVPDPQKCHRSLSNAWPRLLAADLRVNIYIRAFLACSGATTNDLQSKQLPALRKLKGVKLVTVTIGGDDQHLFHDVLQDCYVKGIGTILGGFGTDCVADGTIGRAQKSIETLARHLQSIYNGIKAAAPGAAILVVGYPQLFPSQESNVTGCLWLDSSARAGINSLTSTGDSAVSQAAAAAGVSYVSTLGSLAGHELCTANSWMNPIEAGGSGNAHPNASGQKAMEAAVVSKVVALGFGS